MPLKHPSGATMTDEQAQQRIAETMRRTGVFILSSCYMPAVGEVRTFAGLPLRVVRASTYEEALRHQCADLWGPANLDPQDSYFVVEVAD